MLANRLLSQHPRATRQVIMVTDGEPTAHLEGEVPFFSWPPVRETIELTLAEAMRLSRAGVRLNIFMLEESEGSPVHGASRPHHEGRVFLMDDARGGGVRAPDYGPVARGRHVRPRAGSQRATAREDPGVGSRLRCVCRGGRLRRRPRTPSPRVEDPGARSNAGASDTDRSARERSPAADRGSFASTPAPITICSSAAGARRAGASTSASRRPTFLSTARGRRDQG